MEVCQAMSELSLDTFEPNCMVHNLTKIDECLYLGDFKSATSVEILNQHKIKYVVQLFPADVPGHVHKLSIPIRGGKTTNIAPVLAEALKYIKHNTSKGENVLVHCKHGRNRSASIVIAYLMYSKEISFAHSYNIVYSKRPILRIKDTTKNLLRGKSKDDLESLIN